MLPDSPPTITREFDGWRVSLVRGGRIHTYLCETKAEAEHFAALLLPPTSEQHNRLRTEATQNPGGKKP